eukprot:scaffold2963_cov71-Cylindrotheca_fusiformis.AAC.1
MELGSSRSDQLTQTTTTTTTMPITNLEITAWIGISTERKKQAFVNDFFAGGLEDLGTQDDEAGCR